MSQQRLRDELWRNAAGALAHDLRNDIGALADLVGYVADGTLARADVEQAVSGTAAASRVTQRLLSIPRRMRDATDPPWAPTRCPLTCPCAPAGAEVWAPPAAVEAIVETLTGHRVVELAAVSGGDGWALELRAPWAAWELVDDAQVALCGVIAIDAGGSCLTAERLKLHLPGVPAP